MNKKVAILMTLLVLSLLVLSACSIPRIPSWLVSEANPLVARGTAIAARGLGDRYVRPERYDFFALNSNSSYKNYIRIVPELYHNKVYTEK